MKALTLISGGLDSALAIRVTQEAGATVEALHFLGPLHTGAPAGAGGPDGTPVAGRDAALVAAQAGVPLHTHEFADDYYELLHAPRHGYGRGFNPCIDCRIYQFGIAKGYMDRLDCAFLVTGEVLGQRPMSQHRQALDMIDRESGLSGLVVRPLSAQWLPPTLPEQRGWLDRSRLLAIRGRSRREQYALAAHYGITHYQAPAGGCLLTSPDFARRVRDLVAHGGRLGRLEAERLKVGRHLRLGPAARAIVGRDQGENRRLCELARPGDVLVAVVGHKGPIALGIGELGEDCLRLLAAIAARYSDAPRDGPVAVAYRYARSSADGGAEAGGEAEAAGGEAAVTAQPDGTLAVGAASDDDIARLRI